MKKFFAIAVLAMSFIIAAKPVTAQSKIGYISTEELISIMPETSKADSNLTQFRNALVQNAQEKQNTLESAIESFFVDWSDQVLLLLLQLLLNSLLFSLQILKHFLQLGPLYIFSSLRHRSRVFIEFLDR